MEKVNHLLHSSLLGHYTDGWEYHLVWLMHQQNFSAQNFRELFIWYSGWVCISLPRWCPCALMQFHISSWTSVYCIRLVERKRHDNPEKCKFFQKNKNFLGIKEDGYQIDMKNISAVTFFSETPTSNELWTLIPARIITLLQSRKFKEFYKNCSANIQSHQK